MLKAQNKNQVVKWSQRQLGTKARLVSVSEEINKDNCEFVERDGTGITAQEASGCHPVLSIMANINQYHPGNEEIQKPTIH